MKSTLRLLAIALVFLAGCGDDKGGGSSSPATPGTGSSQPASTGTPNVGTPTTPRREPPVKRPPLIRRQGTYFAWSMPAGWRFNETANGVDIYSPDETEGAGVSVVFNYPGQTTTAQVIDTVNQIAGITDATTISEKTLPDAPGFANIPWKVLERDFRFTYRGRTARRKSTAGVQSYGNGFNAAHGYYACMDKDWEEKSTWLIAIVNSIVVTNPRQLANRDKVTLPKNNPMDHEALRGYWKEKGLSEDRIFQGQREGMMGYEEVESRESGKTFQMPLETYDPTKGGYHNPDNYDEILEKPR